MNIFKRTFVALAVASSMLAVAPANAAFLSNWFIDTDGAGVAAGKVQVTDHLDLLGQGFIQITPTSASTFNFNEFGTFGIASIDDGSTFLSPVLTAQFTARGTGLLNASGSITFTPGATNTFLNLFSGATNIASLSLTAGSANLVANSTIPNGTISLIFNVDSLASGYFFDAGMNDLAGVVSSPDGLLLGFATTNVIALSQTVSTTLLNGFNSAFGTALAPGSIVTNASNPTATNLLISNPGQFRLQIPEPGSMALLGIGLLGLALASRRKQA